MLKTILKATTPFRSYNVKTIHLSAISKLREILIEKKDDKTTVIEAKYVPSPRTPYLLKLNQSSNKCFLCQMQLDLKHTDVLILSQFITSKGEILRKKEIGICEEQYQLIKNLIYMAQHAGLLPEPPRLRPKQPYEKLNTYYDEKTIDVRKRKTKVANKLFKLRLGEIEKLRVRPQDGVGW